MSSYTPASKRYYEKTKSARKQAWQLYKNPQPAEQCNGQCAHAKQLEGEIDRLVNIVATKEQNGPHYDVDKAKLYDIIETLPVQKFLAVYDYVETMVNKKK